MSTTRGTRAKPAGMQGQTLSRVDYPIEHGNERSVFVLKSDSLGPNAHLLKEVRLSLQLLVAGNTADVGFTPRVGAYAILDEILLEDGQGRTLYELREARRWAMVQLARISPQHIRDVTHELSGLRTDLATNPNGTFTYKNDTSQLLTGSAATSPYFTLELHRLVQLFEAAEGVPLAQWAAGELRIRISYVQFSAAEMGATFNVTPGATYPTSWTVSRPALSYRILIPNEPVKVVPGRNLAPITYRQPTLSINALGTERNADIPLGGAGDHISSVVFIACETGAGGVIPLVAHLLGRNTRGAGTNNGSGALLNLKVNGKQHSPNGLTAAAALAEASSVLGPLAVPLGGYSGSGTANQAPDAFLRAFYAFDVRPVRYLPPSPMNATSVDQSGASLNIQRPESAAYNPSNTAATIYAWLMREQTL